LQFFMNSTWSKSVIFWHLNTFDLFDATCHVSNVEVFFVNSLVCSTSPQFYNLI
jgi:hypothetical protein